MLGRVFYTSYYLPSGPPVSPAITLRYLNILGGGASDGAGIFNHGADLTIDTCTISDNIASAQGAGIYNDNPPDTTGHDSVQVMRSLIRSNHATGPGGGIFNAAGASLGVSNSTLTSNTASNRGAVYNLGSAAQVTVTQSTISGNNATGGAGIYLDGPFNAGLTLTGSILSNNQTGNCGKPAVGGVGGDVTDGGYNIVSDASCLFGTGNHSRSSTNALLNPLADNGGPTLTFLPRYGSPAINPATRVYTPPEGTTDQRGMPRLAGLAVDIGAVEVMENCQATIDGTTVYKGGDASAVQMAIDAASTAEGAKIKIAGTCPGGMHEVGGVQVGVVVNKSVTLEGGYSPAAWNLPPDPVGQPTTLDAEGAGRVLQTAAGKSVTLRYLTITGGAAKDGGGVYAAGALTVDQCTITGNDATGDGSAAFGHGGGVYAATALTVSKSTIDENTAALGGGGISSQTSLDMSLSTVSNNTVTDTVHAHVGGGIEADGVTNITTSLLSGNVIANTTTSGGAGLYNKGAATITYSTIRNNTGAFVGGGIYSFGITGDSSTLNVRSCTISGNQANSAGGVYVSGSHTTAVISSSTIVANSASASGMVRAYRRHPHDQGHHPCRQRRRGRKLRQRHCERRVQHRQRDYAAARVGPMDPGATWIPS